MKKIIRFLILTSFLFIVSCGSVFAYYSSSGTMVDVSSLTIGKLKTSLLNDDAYKFMEEFKKDKTNFVVKFGNYREGEVITFMKFPDGLTSKDFRFETNSWESKIKIISCVKITSVSFSTSSGLPCVTDLKIKNYGYSPKSNFLCTFNNFDVDGYVSKCLIDYGYFTGKVGMYAIDKDNLIWSYAANKPQITYTYDDDLKKFEVPVSSEPVSSILTSSESISSTPTSSEPTSSTPVSSIPTTSELTNEYVMFSSSVVKSVFDNIKSTIGTSVNIGWVIFFFIIGICVTLSIIRYFSGE